MSHWKNSAINYDEYKREQEIENGNDSLKLYDDVDDLIKEWSKFHVNESVVRISSFEIIVMLTALSMALSSHQLFKAEDTIFLARIISSGVFILVLSLIAEIYRENKECRKRYAIENQSPQVFKVVIEEISFPIVIENGDFVRIKLPENKWVKIPKNLAISSSGSTPEYYTGREICVVASENLKTVYGVEYKEKILMVEMV